MELNLLIRQSLAEDVGTPRKVVDNQIQPGTGVIQEGEEADYNNPKKPEFKMTEKKLADKSAPDDVDASTKRTGAGPEPTVKEPRDEFHKEGMKLEDASASVFAIAKGYGSMKRKVITEEDSTPAEIAAGSDTKKEQSYLANKRLAIAKAIAAKKGK